MNPISIRLLNQQLYYPQYKDITQVLSFMGAMQAQDIRMMRWAVAMRTQKPSLRAFKRAFDSGEIIRLHLMRGTWQVLASQDYNWMRDLCSPKAIAAIKGWMNSNKIHIPEEETAKVREILARTASGKGSATKEDFVHALAEKDMKMDGQRLSYHIRMAELEGILCSGDLLPMRASYSLTEHRIKPQGKIDRDEMLMRLAHKYFQSRQPATLEDFVWWSGLSIGDCRKGIELLGSWIHTEESEGRKFYLTENCRKHGFRKGQYLLLPPYDEYLIAYKSREIVLAPEHRHRAHNNSGIFRPVIAGDGLICGNWDPYSSECLSDFFSGTHNPDTLSAERLRYLSYLNAI